ncbi:hypothetical protein [Mucispirillum schaedleri]|uniref:hypothetical protein n=1 Tax=Mucispirillum schaedleri TaxID=248039 RepID=UPI001F5A404C|nr:hypothetical protein [Mucispirillum schaedleri]
MRIKQKYEKILDECIETIYNCSMDTSNNKALVDDNSKIINFDMVTKKYSTQNLIKNNYPQSIDSLYINENIDAIFFIEFKNKHKIEKVGIKNKIYSSVYILMDIFNLTTDFVRDNIQFILVYKQKEYKQDEAYKQIVLETQNYAQETGIRFNMNEYKSIFKNVYTYTSDEFKHNFIDKYCATI